MNAATPSIRPGRDADAAGIIALIGACWGEYPSIVFDLDAEVPELRALASYYGAQGGTLWVAEADRCVAGMIAVVPRDGGAWEICRLYVLAAWRGDGLAHRLLGLAEQQARASGATRLILWSDTRFERAHRFYEKRGYVRSGPIRVLADLSDTLEFGYAKPVDGVEVLDAAAAASAERCLAELLMACVADGASEGFLPPLAADTARAFWRRAASGVAKATTVLLAGWIDGTLVGCVALDLATPLNQPHHATVEMLLVHPAVRRRGLARALMRRLEAAAAQAGRTLLTLRARADDPVVAFCQSEGWTAAGVIPQLMLGADGTFRDAMDLWKQIAATSAPPR
jgi:GNAT superfamily N-acetyltransferase